MKYILIIILSLSILNAFSQEQKSVEFINNENNDSLLLVMISGYKGAEVWSDFKDLILLDDSLKEYDLLIYGLTQKLNIDENINQIANNVSYYGAKYKEYFLLSYSLGGIVTKNFILNDLHSEAKILKKIGYIVFIGTPYFNDNFTVSAIKRGLGFFAKPFVNPLLRDASRGKKIKEINDNWISEIEYSNINYIGNITIFGRDDDLVEPELFETEIKGDSRIIDGTHSELVVGINKDHCSYKIVRSKLLNKRSNINAISCINP